MADGAVVLNPPVVADAQDGAVVGNQGTANRHTALLATNPGLGDGQGQEGCTYWLLGGTSLWTRSNSYWMPCSSSQRHKYVVAPES
jgi:hypothetical protein